MGVGVWLRDWVGGHQSLIFCVLCFTPFPSEAYRFLKSFTIGKDAEHFLPSDRARLRLVGGQLLFNLRQFILYLRQAHF